VKKFGISVRSIEYLIGIFATLCLSLVVFIYAAQEPLRIALAQEAQMYADLDDAMTLYAENCVVCHGLSGEGIGSTPALNNIAIRSYDYDALYKIVERGLYSTAMPAWSLNDGGPLSEYQINELVTLIQFGNWNETQDRVVNLGLAPLVPFTSDPDPSILESIQSLDGNDLLVRGVRIYAVECVACHGPDGLGTSFAPPLNDPIILTTSKDELRRVILNGVSGTLMAPWRNRFNDEDINSLITLLTSWDTVPVGVIPAPEQAIVVTEESLELGSELYTRNCARCHGPEGQGTQRAPSLNVKGFLVDNTDAAMQQIITLGVPGTSMPAWVDRMTEVEIQAIVGYIRAWEASAPEVAEPARGGGRWWQPDGSAPQGGGSGGGPPWMRNANENLQWNVPFPGGDSNLKIHSQSDRTDR